VGVGAKAFSGHCRLANRSHAEQPPPKPVPASRQRPFVAHPMLRHKWNRELAHKTSGPPGGSRAGQSAVSGS